VQKRISEKNPLALYPASIAHASCYRIPVTGYLLPVAGYLLPVAGYLLPGTGLSQDATLVQGT